MFFARQQRKGVEVIFIGRFAVGLHDFAIDDELDLGDFSLSASLDDDNFWVGDFLFGRRHKVVIQRRWQRSHFKFGAQPADIAFHIFDSDIQLMLARLQFNRLDRVAWLGRDQLAIQDNLDTFDILVGADFHGDMRVFGDGRDEKLVGQEQQRDGDGRAQEGAAGAAAAIGCGDIQAEIVACAIGRHIGADGDDILAAEDKGKLAEDGRQFVRRGRVIKCRVGLRGDCFQKAPVDIPAQADRIDWHAIDGGGADALLARAAADIAIFAAIAQDDHSAAGQGCRGRQLDPAQRRII